MYMGTFGGHTCHHGETIIFHVDVNSAFLSWSAVRQLQDDPSSVDLRKIPSIVGGRKDSRRGVVTAKSIPAKRYGIITGEPVMKALEKCPNLVMVPADFAWYRECSHNVMTILRSYAPKVQQVSIDEAYLDLTGTESIYEHLSTEQSPYPYCIAEAIKNEIRQTLGFTVNVGISSNKLLAKMASDMEKPNRIHTLFPEEIPDKMWPLPMGELHGCGKATTEQLRRLGIRTIGEAARTAPHILIQALGEKTGTYIWNKANGIASSVVRTDHVEAKSYSNETTVAKDITESNYEERMPDILLALCDSVARRLHKDDVYGKTITFQVKTNDFHRHSRQISLADSTRDAGILYNTVTRIADELLFGNHGLFAKGLGVRLVGVGVSGIDHGQYRQMNLFDLLEDPADVSHTAKDVPEIPLGQEQRSQALADMRNLLEHKYGRSVLKRASELKKSSDQSNLDRLKTKK
ncbi:MAG: DNA polymerase IV [Lachnospiraceae bacterium]|nr:DNA polymerase IV [Lachnospiraceae bacterium]